MDVDGHPPVELLKVVVVAGMRPVGVKVVKNNSDPPRLYWSVKHHHQQVEVVIPSRVLLTAFEGHKAVDLVLETASTWRG